MGVIKVFQVGQIQLEVEASMIIDLTYILDRWRIILPKFLKMDLSRMYDGSIHTAQPWVWIHSKLKKLELQYRSWKIFSDLLKHEGETLKEQFHVWILVVRKKSQKNGTSL